MKGLLVALALPLALVISPSACDHATPHGGGASPPAPSSSTATPPPSATPPATSSVEAQAVADDDDFEDQFAYGLIDAGAGNPAALAPPITYRPYANARFGFSLDAPAALTAMPEPTNGDGLQWRLGHLVAMTASGMHALPELPLECAHSSHVTAHKESKTSCWATGKRDGFVFWERKVIAHEVLYSLRFQYAESAKAAMDPIVTHVNASWKY